MATAEELGLLRVTVNGDFDRAEEMSRELRSEGKLNGYPEVIAAAFYIAVRKQFKDQGGYSPDDVIRLVAETRALLDRTGDLIDPRSVELAVRSALGERGVAAHLSDAVKVQAQVAVVSVLAHEGKLGDPDSFMDEVTALLARWGQPQPAN